MVAFIYSFAEFLSCAVSNSWRLCYKLQVKYLKETVHCAASSMVCVKFCDIRFYFMHSISMCQVTSNYCEIKSLLVKAFLRVVFRIYCTLEKP